MKSFEVEKNTKKLISKAVYIGVSEAAAGYTYENGAVLEDVAMYMNYGTQKTPERDFITLPFQVKKNALKTAQAKILKGELNAQKSLRLLGEFGRNIIIEAFESGGFGLWAPDSLYTIEHKGSAMPLVDTGVLKSSISYEVAKS